MTSVTRLGVLLLVLLAPACLTEIGPDGAYFHTELADRVCLSASFMGSSVALGHCTGGNDATRLPGVEGDQAGPERGGDEEEVGLRPQR